MLRGRQRHVAPRPRVAGRGSAAPRGQMPPRPPVRKYVPPPGRVAAPVPGVARSTCPCTCGNRVAADELFVDEEFPARWDSLADPCDAVEWKRPHEICEEPKLFVDSCSRFDVNQGGLGTCYFLAACAAVADRPDLLNKVVPEGQVLYGSGYDGSVIFRFWNMGEWEEVRIDDRLPVDTGGNLVYSHCPSSDEFWLPLLEKAFARYHGLYRDVNGGFITDGLMALTGFTVETMNLCNWTATSQFTRMHLAMAKGAVVVCGTDNPGQGIPDSHAYTVSKVVCVRDGNEESDICMVRVRNPWGDDTEWTGAWSDGDKRWDKLNDNVKKRMEYRVKRDGEFWMEMKDFAEAFPEVAILREKPDGFEGSRIVAQLIGRWTAEEEVGGLPNNVECFAKNPQFRLLINKETNSISVDNEEEEIENEIIYIDLIQNVETGAGFYVFETESPVRTKLTTEQLLAARPIAVAQAEATACGTGTEMVLAPGKPYVVVPCTDTPGYPGDFLLRVFGLHRASFQEIYEHTCCLCPCD